MPITIITVHGIEFDRKGKCNSCGLCDCGDCVHADVSKNMAYCKIYDTRDQICKECSDARGREVTHQNCIDYPQHPYLLLQRKGLCGYYFERTDHQSMDTIPLLNGEPYDKS